MNTLRLLATAIAGQAVEVAPAAHFFMGGVQIDEQTRTAVPGLFAAGEVTGGTHGANRLSGNAFAQIVTQGARAGQAAAGFAHQEGYGAPPPDSLLRELFERIHLPLQRTNGVTAYELRRELQQIAAEKVGVLRSGEALRDAVGRLEQLRRDALPRVYSRCKDRHYNREWAECLQVENMLVTLIAIARSALLREESRGAHYRRDFPKTDHRHWLRNTMVTLRADEFQLTTSPVRITTLQPEEGDGG